MLMGEYSHSLDTKGRLIMPAKLRQDIGDKFILTKGQYHETHGAYSDLNIRKMKTFKGGIEKKFPRANFFLHNRPPPPYDQILDPPLH